MYSSFEGFETKDASGQQFNSFIIDSDEMRLKQIVMNLQSNALKFTKPGGKVKIKVMLIKSEKSLNKDRKNLSLFNKSFASDSSSSNSSINSDTLKFDKEYGLKNVL